MADEPHAVKAAVGWADFGVRCPACDHLNTTGDGWEEVVLMAGGTWGPTPEHRFMLCDGDGCDLLLELPDVSLTLTYGRDRFPPDAPAASGRAMKPEDGQLRDLQQ